MNKVINSKCICKKGLPWIHCRVIMMEPCEHILHDKCYRSLKDRYICPMCNTPIMNTRSLTDKVTNEKQRQQFIDLLSMTNSRDTYKAKPIDVLDNIIDLTDILISMPFTRGVSQGRELCKKIFSMNDIDIVVKGEDKLLKSEKVFISNHTCYLDFIVLFYILKTGFLASHFINESWVGQQIAKIVQLLIIKRGKNVNTVEKIAEYVKKHNSICLFPEGMITHQDTIIRYRTGAFYSGFPVQPVVLRYDPVPSESGITEFITKWASCKKMNITVEILDPFYPPFDDQKIERVREVMAKAGNMYLSRVSNKDIVDK